MKTASLVSLLAASAYAAPLEARDGPGHSSMAGMGGMAGMGAAAGAAAGTAAGGAAGGAGGLDLSELLKGFDMSKLGDIMQNIDMSKIGELMQGVDMSKIGDLMANFDPSKLGDLMKGVDMSKVGDLMKGVDMSKIGDLMKGGDLSKLAGALPPDLAKSFGSYFATNNAVQKAVTIESVKPLLRPDAKRVKIVYGPYKIKGTATKGKVGNGFSLDPSGTGYFYNAGDDFPRDITIIDVKSGVFDENYVPIDIGKGLYNHHNVFYDSSKATTNIVGCASGKAGFTVPMSIFMGGATESTTMPYTSIDGKFNSGYYLSKNATVSSMLDVVNYKPEDQNVYVISEMEYVPGQIADALPASSQVIDIGSCSAAGGAGFSVHPPEGVKQWTLNSTDIILSKTGYLLSGKAHFHDGAVQMKIWLNDKLICTSKAEYGGAGREGTNPDGTKWEGLGGTTTCDKVIPVKNGDKLRLSADFDVEKHPERQFEGQAAHGEGMGGHDEGEMSMAEGMALFTTAFAEEVPGANPRYLFTAA